MNLWVKRAGQLALSAVALFFFSCKDDITRLGFPNPNSKFNIKYVEIPLESSVYLIDSIRTSNAFGELNRIMVGKYSDPAFGDVKATAFLEFSPYNTSLGIADADLIDIDYDSVYLDMRLDFYSYGSSGSSKQAFNVHVLNELISSDADERAANRFYSKKNDVDYDPAYIGTDTIEVNSAEFKSEFDKGASEMKNRMLHIKLDDDFGQRLLTRAKEGGDPYKLQDKFNEAFKGLAIVPGDNNDKIIGFDHTNSLRSDTIQSRLVVFFHLPEDTTYRTVSFNLNYISYTNLEINRTAMNSPDLYDITDTYVTKDPPVYRYSQTGTGVVTRIDFTNFYNFADTIDRMIINSAELAITGFETPNQYYPINNFTMLMLDSTDNASYRNTRYLRHYFRDNDGKIIDSTDYVHPWDQQFVNSHAGYISNQSGFLTAMGDNGSAVALRRDGDKFSSYMTLLAQQMYYSTGGDHRIRYFGLFPSDPPNGKSLNRLIFNKNNLKLKVYYTIPTQPSN